MPNRRGSSSSAGGSASALVRFAEAFLGLVSGFFPVRFLLWDEAAAGGFLLGALPLAGGFFALVAISLPEPSHVHDAHAFLKPVISGGTAPHEAPTLARVALASHTPCVQQLAFHTCPLSC